MNIQHGVMDLLIENKLSEYKTHIIDYATLKSILRNMNYENINNKIVNLRKKNILKSVKKGLYIHNSQITKNIISKELISNILLDNPSYISLDYALHFHGLIPESVHEITAITTKRSKVFKTEIGVFSYKQIRKELFGLGITIEKREHVTFLIASKEKAICDKIYLTSGVELNSKTSMIDFLENDLRIDIEDLEGLDSSIFLEYYKISKSKKINILLNLIQEL
jgi:predicted transcriptional regulator of viral defense system